MPLFLKVPEIIVSNDVLSDIHLKKYLLHGWDISEPSIIWGVGLESKLAFSFDEVQLSSIKFDCFLLKRAKFGEVQILINSSIFQSQPLASSTIVYLPPISICTLEVLFRFTEIDNFTDSKDKRLVTFHLSNLSFHPRSDGELEVLFSDRRIFESLRFKLGLYIRKNLRALLPRKVKTVLRSLYFRIVNAL